jgi:hypothetical protein
MDPEGHSAEEKRAQTLTAASMPGFMHKKTLFVPCWPVKTLYRPAFAGLDYTFLSQLIMGTQPPHYYKANRGEGPYGISARYPGAQESAAFLVSEALIGICSRRFTAQRPLGAFGAFHTFRRADYHYCNSARRINRLRRCVFDCGQHADAKADIFSA